MKSNHLLLALALFLSAGLFGQQKNIRSSEVPAATVAAFQKNFSGASKVKWEKENGAYEVNFVQNSKEMSALLDSKGDLKETEVEIKVSELPSQVTEYVKKNYNASVEKAAKITKANGEVTYEAEVKHKDVIFNSNGKFIKEEKD